ncbi:MAG: hypothetical protein JWL59_4110 [Chthoniobacteraceae bacterium]|nr:hypothetical protein [Chthoniobacteraceae bacterium]
MVSRFTRAVRRLLAIPARRAFQARLDRIPFTLPAERPVLNYGSVLSRTKGGIVQGGKVKLLHLTGLFPENANQFNLLYLVSSAIPPHGLELARWAKARGVKLVWNQNGVGFPAWAGAGFEEINRPMRELLRMADYVFYQSAFCQQSATRFLGEARCGSSLVFNPVDTALFAPAKNPPPPSPVRLLTAGTHHQPYRVTSAIECLRILREKMDARLTIAGGLRWRGAEAQIKAMVAGLGLENAVTLHPAYTQKEAVALFQDAHFLLHPKFNDPCPTVVIEAMACGLPVIGSASGGMPELVGEDGGRLLTPSEQTWERLHPPDPGQMAEAVIELMQSWPIHSQAARARAERLFNKELWVERHRAVFERLTSQ